jgi:hypothetical protein
LKGIVVPRTAVRVFLVILALLVASLGAAIEARGENSTPVLELLEPAYRGTVVVSPDENKWPVYRFRVTYPDGYTGTWEVALETSLDAAFTKNRSLSKLLCATNVSVCDLSITSRTRYERDTRVFWRVSIPGGIVSPTQSFFTAGPSDRDLDGVPDFKDNCPSTSNPRQTDFERDGKGDACQPDRKTPRVKAYAGSARQGQHARFLWRATDNRPISVRLTLRWSGQVMVENWWSVVIRTVWRGPAFHWTSENRLDTRWPTGTYRFCVIATDGAGNKGTSCAPYKIRG